MDLTIEHVGLASANPEGLREWFCRVLEAKVVFADGKTPPAFLMQVGPGPLVEIYASDLRLEQTGHNRLAGWRHLALRVPQIEAARDLLLQRGVQFEGEIKPAGGGGRVLFFKDPEGNLWHLVERSSDSVVTPLKPT